MDPNRKPLVVYGSKQVGKTYTVLLDFEISKNDTLVIIDNVNDVEIVNQLKL